MKPRPLVPQAAVDSALPKAGAFGCNQKKLPLPARLSTPPAVAWPTVLLAVVALTWYCYTHMRYFYVGDVSYSSALFQWAAAAYLSFTPTHDATHDSIASSRVGRRLAKFVNAATGRLCALPLCAPFFAFRYLHLQHHKFTNVDGKDPDLWSSLPPSLSTMVTTSSSTGSGKFVLGQLLVLCVMPLKWVSQIYSYLFHYWHHRAERPRDEVAETLVMAAVQVVYPLVSLVLFGKDSGMFWCYALPGYLAIGFLACTFDYLPHRPHGTTDIYRGTNLTAIYATTKVGGGGAEVGCGLTYITSPLTWLMLYQNYHVVHHLYPWVPFYRYSAVWTELESQLLAAGVPVVPLLPIAIPRKSSTEGKIS